MKCNRTFLAVTMTSAAIFAQGCSTTAQPDVTTTTPDREAAATLPSTSITFDNRTSSRVKIYYMNDLYEVQKSPGYTCNVITGRLTWATTVLKPQTSTTVYGSQSGQNVCVSVGVPTESNTEPGQPYKGPYLIQNTKKGVLVEQTWMSNPVSSEFFRGMSQTLNQGSSWSDPADFNRVKFSRGSDQGGSPQVTMTVSPT